MIFNLVSNFGDQSLSWIICNDNFLVSADFISMATSEFEDQEDETIKFINPTASASTSTVIAEGTIFLHILNYKKSSETRIQLYSLRK